AFRRPPLANDRCDLTLVAGINKNESFTTEAVEILLDDPSGEKRSNSCIKCVASPRENFESSGSRERVSCRDGAIMFHNRRTFSCASEGYDEYTQKQDGSYSFRHGHFFGDCIAKRQEIVGQT